MPRETPSHLVAGPLRIPLVPGPQGPILDEEPDLEGLAWILMTAIGDPEAFAATQTGASWFHEIMELRPPAAGDDLAAAREAWRRWTGQELDGELRMLRVGGYDPVVLPLAVLGEAVRTLKALREEFRIEPPWLFTEPSRWNQGHGSERDRVRAAETRLAEGGGAEELKALGLASPVFREEKLEWLMRWGAPGLAGRYAEVLGAPGPWLFRGDPLRDVPHPAERALLSGLEGEAEAIDRDEFALNGATDPPELVERRSRLLRRLEGVGLLDRPRHGEKAHWLGEWKLETLRKLQEAAMAGLDYLESTERSRYNRDPTERRILEAPVCLDIFRSLKTPPGVSRFAWISWGEFLLRKHGPRRDVTADQGDFPYHDRDGLVIVLWRKDAGFPALRYVALRSGRPDQG